MVQSYFARDGCSFGTFLVGCLQLLTTALLFGWCWSIWHGMMVKYVSAPDFEGLPAPESDFPEDEEINGE